MWQNRKKSSRGRSREFVQHENPEKSPVREHAMFVRFMERHGLSSCVRYFPENMSLSQLKGATQFELINIFHITSAADRDSILKAIEEINNFHTKAEDRSDDAFSSW